MSDAARALASGAPHILTVALDAGYNSHEAFTRAFRDRFDETPETVRDRGSLDGLALIDPLKLGPPADIGLEPPRFIDSPLTRVVGLSELRSFDTIITIPGQWERFMERWYDAVPDQVEAMPIGVYRPADDDGRFLYMCATEVRRFGEHPAALQRLEIPARQYAVFEHRGHVATIFETYASIWNSAMPATGRTVANAPVIERHNSTFAPGTGEGGLTLWIPLAD